MLHNESFRKLCCLFNRPFHDPFEHYDIIGFPIKFNNNIMTYEDLMNSDIYFYNFSSFETEYHFHIFGKSKDKFFVLSYSRYDDTGGCTREFEMSDVDDIFNNYYIVDMIHNKHASIFCSQKYCITKDKNVIGDEYKKLNIYDTLPIIMYLGRYDSDIEFVNKLGLKNITLCSNNKEIIF